MKGDLKMTKNYKEVTGKVLTICKGHGATIQIGEQIITTSPVIEITMIWNGKITFETQNTIYEVKEEKAA